MTIANMTTEWGRTCGGVFHSDEVTVKYLRSTCPRVHEVRNGPGGSAGPTSRSGYTKRRHRRVVEGPKRISALTPDAEYAIELENLILATVVPHVSGPNEVKTMVSLLGNGAKTCAYSEGIFVIVP